MVSVSVVIMENLYLCSVKCLKKCTCHGLRVVSTVFFLYFFYFSVVCYKGLCNKGGPKTRGGGGLKLK